MALLIVSTVVTAASSVVTAYFVVASGKGISAEATGSDDTEAEVVFRHAVLKRTEKVPAAR